MKDKSVVMGLCCFVELTCDKNSLGCVWVQLGEDLFDVVELHLLCLVGWTASVYFLQCEVCEYVTEALLDLFGGSGCPVRERSQTVGFAPQ